MAVSGDSFSSKIQCSQEGVQQPGHVLFLEKIDIYVSQAFSIRVAVVLDR